MEKGKARKICVSTARMANVLKMGGGTNELKVLKNWDRVSGGEKRQEKSRSVLSFDKYLCRPMSGSMVNLFGFTSPS